MLVRYLIIALASRHKPLFPSPFFAYYPQKGSESFFLVDDTRGGHGGQVSFIIKERKPAPTHTDWMKARVDSDKGKRIYNHCMSVVDRLLLLHNLQFRHPWRSTVFANMGSNKRVNRFSLRGKKRVQGQWQLYCLVHNIEKLQNYGQLAH